MVDRNLGFALSRDVYYHRRLIAERGEVRSFTLQIDIWEDGKWHTIVRCDSSHGEAHIDFIDPEGRTYDKRWLGVHRPYNDTYNQVEADFRATWRDHVARWQRQKGDRR
ncbi:MAG: DUF7718 family protein [Thermomicrobiales bacterium]